MPDKIPKSYLDYSFSSADEMWLYDSQEKGEWVKRFSLEKVVFTYGFKIWDGSNRQYIDDIPNGLAPIGIWRKRNCQHPFIFGRPPKNSVWEAEMIEYSDGSFLVRPVGFSNTWEGINARCSLWDNIDTAIYDLELRIDYSNYKAYRWEIGWMIFNSIFGASLVYLFYSYYFQ